MYCSNGTRKSQSLLHILYLEHIIDKLGHFIGITRITGPETENRRYHRSLLQNTPGASFTKLFMTELIHKT